jgi:hypothetical protein
MALRDERAGNKRKSANNFLNCSREGPPGPRMLGEAVLEETRGTRFPHSLPSVICSHTNTRMEVRC